MLMVNDVALQFLLTTLVRSNHIRVWYLTSSGIPIVIRRLRGEQTHGAILDRLDLRHVIEYTRPASNLSNDRKRSSEDPAMIHGHTFPDKVMVICGPYALRT